MLLFTTHGVPESQGRPELPWKKLGRQELAGDESGSCWMTQLCGWTLCVSRNKEVDICAIMSLHPGLCYQQIGSWKHCLSRSYTYFITSPKQHNSSGLGWINDSRNLSLDPHLLRLWSREVSIITSRSFVFHYLRFCLMSNPLYFLGSWCGSHINRQL